MKSILEFALFFNATLLGSLVLHSLIHSECDGPSPIVIGEGCRYGGRETAVARKYAGKLREGSLGRVESECSIGQEARGRDPGSRLAEAEVPIEAIEAQATPSPGGQGAKFTRANYHAVNPERNCLRFVSYAYEVPVERQHGGAGLSGSLVARTTPSVILPQEVGVHILWDDQSISRREAERIFSDPALRSQVLSHPQAVDMMRSAMQSDPGFKRKLEDINDSPRLARGILMTPVGKTSWGYQGMGMTAQETDKLIAMVQTIMSSKGVAKK